MKNTKQILGLILLWSIFTATVIAQQYRMPQDNWCFNGLRISGNFGAIAIGPDNNIYAAENNSFISVFTTGGVLVRQFGTNMNIAGLALDTETNLFVLDLTPVTNHVRKFSPNGGLLLTFAGHGNNLTEILPGPGYSRITVGKDNNVYVADDGNYRVQVYDKNGNHLFAWGQTSGGGGNFPSRFLELDSIAALPNGNICVRNSYPYAFNTKTYELQMFSFDGQFLALKTPLSVQNNNSIVSRAIAATPDGLVWSWQGLQSVTGSGSGADAQAIFHIYSGDTSVGNTSDSAIAYNMRVRALPYVISPAERVAASFDRAGNIYLTTSGNIFGGKRVFGTDAGLAATTLPQPHILSVTQRPNSSLVDIVYKVVEPGTNQVATTLLGFINNGNDLSSVKKVTAFVENTGTNVGPTITANQSLLLTWDASESATNFANFQFEILAHDNRSLMALNYVTIPAAQTNSALTLSRTSVTDNDLLSLWFWLIGNTDPAISLTNGEVIGVGGVYNGQTLASGASTTSPGRAFLYQRLNVRAPTAAEVARAQSGNYGFISVDGNNVVKLP